MFRVEMEDGTFEDVAEINLGDNKNGVPLVTNNFVVHAWFNIWTSASLPDWQVLFESETGKTVLMGEVRKFGYKLATQQKRNCNDHSHHLE